MAPSASRLYGAAGPRLKKGFTVRLVALMALTLTALEAFADEGPVFDVPPGFAFAQEVAYGTQSPNQRLNILYPHSAATPLPAVIHIHGGGWYTGGKGGESTFAVLRRFAEEGYVALSIGYRFIDEKRFPGAVEDCKLAVRWLRAHAEAYKVDPERIGVFGASAGGHLAAMLAVAGPDAGLEGAGGYNRFSSAIQAAIPICAPLDLRVPISMQFANNDDPIVNGFIGGPPSTHLTMARRASPMIYVRAGLPPMLFVHGTADKRVVPAQSEAMAAALQAAGSPATLRLIPDGKHGMGEARAEPVLSEMVAFFDKTLRAN